MQVERPPVTGSGRAGVVLVAGGRNSLPAALAPNVAGASAMAARASSFRHGSPSGFRGAWLSPARPAALLGEEFSRISQEELDHLARQVPTLCLQAFLHSLRDKLRSTGFEHKATLIPPGVHSSVFDKTQWISP